MRPPSIRGKAFRLYCALVAHRGRVVSPSLLMQLADIPTPQALNTHLRSLRDALVNTPDEIVTHALQGYMLRKREEPL